MPNQGVFIVLEGADGSGKGTQFRLLAERLKAVGYDVEVFDFPRYDQPSSHFVRAYLNGEYGPADKVSPYTASLFYALDRFEAAPQIRSALEGGKVVLSNRYVGSNMAHQGAKLSDPVNQRGFFVWEDSLEFQLLGIPRPNINLFLSVPAEVSYRLISKKLKRGYTQRSRDEHEADIAHLRSAVATYELLCQLFPKDFVAIEAASKDKILPITDINNKIWQVIKPILPKPPNKGVGATVKLDSLADAAKVLPKNNQPLAEPQPSSSRQKILKLNKISLLAANFIAFEGGISVKIKPLGWPEDRRAYFVPAKMPDKVAEIYRQSLDKIGENYKSLEETLAADAKRHKKAGTSGGVLKRLWPMSMLCSIEITADESALEHLALRMAGSGFSELEWGAHQIKANDELIRDVKNDQPDTLAKLAKNQLPPNNAPSAEPVTLLEAWPRNEFELLTDSIYPHSELPHGDIGRSIEFWKYEDKKNALLDSINRSPLLLEQVHYKWDAVGEQSELIKLFQVIEPESLQLQTQTPRYGYEVPSLVETAAAEDTYQECFDESLRLFSSLQAAGLANQAAYATLMGHKVRCQFVTNARKLILALNDPVAKHSSLLQAMVEKLSEVHPLIASSVATVLEPAKSKKPKSPSTRSRRATSRRRKK